MTTPDEKREWLDQAALVVMRDLKSQRERGLLRGGDPVADAMEFAFIDAWEEGQPPTFKLERKETLNDDA